MQIHEAILRDIAAVLVGAGLTEVQAIAHLTFMSFHIFKHGAQEAPNDQAFLFGTMSTRLAGEVNDHLRMKRN